MSSKLWNFLDELKSDRYAWVELSYEVSPATPHWYGYPDISEDMFLDFHENGFDVKAVTYHVVSQYGTHVDAPTHFDPQGRSLEQIPATTMVNPLCVIDVSAKAAANNDYQLQVEDILDWEAANGPLPDGAFVAMRTDWSKRSDLNNYDADNNPHYPGWSMAALEFLVKERNVNAMGHETPDTDAPAAGLGWVGERYVLKSDKYQIELLRNLDQVPAAGAIILTFWPNVKNGCGFTARCVAICEK